jgi:stage V sporulation protein G
MSTLQFSVERMFCFPDNGKLKAYADVGVNDTIVIRGFRVVDNHQGLFVSMPQEQGKDKKWYDQVSCKDTRVKQEIEKVVLEHYKTVSKK